MVTPTFEKEIFDILMEHKSKEMMHRVGYISAS
jgi:hypothetical protein